MLFGSAVHSAAEKYLHLSALGRNVDLGDSWRKKFWGHLSKLERSSGIDWRGHTREAVYADGVRLLVSPEEIEVESQASGDAAERASHPSMAHYLDSIEVAVADGKPAIERRVSMRVPGVDVPVVGFIDWLGRDGIPADLKTASSPWTIQQAELELQPTFYLAALQQLGYDANPDGAFRHYVLHPRGDPNVQVFETRRNGADIEWLCDLIRQVWECISAGRFHPNPTYRWCQPKTCEYWDICRGKGGPDA
jgi:hypothetical protein